jgi:sigma-54 specific flagellar transcriptional regulator A
VLQEKVVDPVGSNSPVKVDVRVVAATHQNIEALIKEGKFREDLYYRINVIPIEIPPLRSRIEDIDLLINKFIEKNTIHFDDSVIAYLKAYHWPGNIRELINFIQRIKAIANTNKIKLEEIPDFVLPRIDANLKNNAKDNGMNNIKKESIDFNDLLVDKNNDEKEENLNFIPETGVDLKKSVTDMEIALIKEALKKSDGNVTKAAKLLTLGRTTLIEKINKYKLN